jgi:hypothetical protein
MTHDDSPAYLENGPKIHRSRGMMTCMQHLPSLRCPFCKVSDVPRSPSTGVVCAAVPLVGTRPEHR